MVHVDDAPFAFLLLAKGGATGINGVIRQFDFHIVFHPNRVPYEVVPTRRDGQLGRRLHVEVVVAVILHAGLTSVVVAGKGEDDDLRIQAVGEGAFIGAIESLFAGLELLVQLGNASLSLAGIRRQVGYVVFKVYGDAELPEKIDAEDAVDPPAARTADRREIHRVETDVFEMLPADGQISHDDFLAFGFRGSGPGRNSKPARVAVRE